MGGAFSSNVVNAIENVANTIQTQSQASSQQQAQCVNQIQLNNCVIEGNLNIQTVCDVVATSTQIHDQITSSNLTSSIAQNVLQQAQSLVGALGIGFADASNMANAMINSTNSIITTMDTISNQNASSFTSFQCKDTVINGSVTLGINSSINFLSQQMIKQQSVNDIVSNVSQSVSQSASSTVQGLTGLILAVAILLFAIGYVLFRPIGMALGNKFIMVTLITIIIVAIIVALYLFQLPPFFNPPVTCTPLPTTAGSCNGQDSCLTPSSQKIAINGPPLRYAYDIIGQGDRTVPGQGSTQFKAGLLQMVIAKFGGWTQQGFTNLDQYFREPTSGTEGNIPPNPLVLASTTPPTYITNINQWNAYIAQPQNVGHSRFILCQALEIDTTIYILNTEKCYVNGKVIVPNASECYQFVPSGPFPTDRSLLTAVGTGGSVTGMFGVCNSPSYRIQTFMKKGGFLIPVGFFVVAMLFVLFYNNSPSTPKSSSSTPTPSSSASSSSENSPSK